MATAFIRFHDLQPLLQIAGKAGAGGAVNGRTGATAEHHHGATGRSAPTLLRGADQHINAGRLHIDPDGARCNAVQHQQAAHGVHCIGHAAQVAVGQHHAGGSFDVRCKHHIWAFACNGGHDFFHRAWNPRRLLGVSDAAGHQDRGLGRDVAHVKNLRPTVAEPAIADDQCFFVGGKLARHGFHAKRATAGHQNGRLGVVHLFQDGRDVAHHTLEALRHMVQRAVGVDHRKFKQALGIDLGQKAGHGSLLWS